MEKTVDSPINPEYDRITIKVDLGNILRSCAVRPCELSNILEC